MENKSVEKFVAVTKLTDKKKTEMVVFNYDPSTIVPMVEEVKSKSAALAGLNKKIKHKQ